MAKLIYAMITSLDGYVADAKGEFDWAAPDEELHAYVNDLERNVGTYLYGRRMYETMAVWQTFGDDNPVTRDFAELWRAADKIVYSTTMRWASTPRTTLEPRFDPNVVRRLTESAERDVSIGGPGLAAQAIRAGIVEEWHQFVTPVVVGGGTPALPADVRVELELVDEHRFGSGVVHLHHRTRR